MIHRSSVLAGLVAGALALFGGATSAHAGTLALDALDDAQVYTLAGAPTDSTNGWQFAVTQSVLVDGLGVFDVDSDGLAESHQVAIWDRSDNSLVVSATIQVRTLSTLVSATTVEGDWRFESVAPTLLGPGDYVIGAHYATSADDVLYFPAPSTTNSSITYAQRASSVIGDGFTMPGTFAGPPSRGGIFGPTFSITPVPEPTTMALFGIGALGLVMVGRRRKQARQATESSES